MESSQWSYSYNYNNNLKNIIIKRLVYESVLTDSHNTDQDEKAIHASLNVLTIKSWVSGPLAHTQTNTYYGIWVGQFLGAIVVSFQREGFFPVER